MKRGAVNFEGGRPKIEGGGGGAAPRYVALDESLERSKDKRC